MTISFSRFTNRFKFLARTFYLSVSSSDFYADIHNRYRGYGIKYILILYLISGIIFSVCAFSNLIALENNITPSNPDVEYIIKQMPDMYYDGNALTTQAEMPLFIYDKDNHKVAAIDFKKELSQVDKNKLYIVFNENSMQLPVKMGLTNNNNMNAEYKYLFGTQSAAITSDTIGSFLPKLWSKLNNAYIYIVIPLVGLIYFIAILLYNIPYAIFVWLVCYFWHAMDRSSNKFFSNELIQIFDLKNSKVTSLQTAYRITMFASSASVFLQPILSIMGPNFLPIVAALSLASWIFMIMGIVKVKKNL